MLYQVRLHILVKCLECIIHPSDPDILYCSYQRGNIAKSIDGGRNFNENIMTTITESGEWVTPYVMHPTNPDILYAGFRNVWKTENGGTNWNKISDFSNEASMGQVSQVSSIAVSRSNPDNIYVAKRPYFFYNVSSALLKTTDGGNNWTDITAGLPSQLYFLYIAVDNGNPNTAWVTCAGFEDGNKVFKTTDGGANWENISRNLPNLPVNCIAEHQGKDYNPIYIGMDVGVYYTNDTMSQWLLFNDELPNVIISELEVHEASNQLYAATFGRGIWKVDLYESNELTAIDEVIYDINVNVTPNPNNGIFELNIDNIDLDRVMFRIVDITGRIVHHSEIEINSSVYRKTYDLGLKPGNYYAIISHNNRSKTIKFIVY